MTDCTIQQRTGLKRKALKKKCFVEIFPNCFLNSVSATLATPNVARQKSECRNVQLVGRFDTRVQMLGEAAGPDVP
jgi:hypothetical protein